MGLTLTYAPELVLGMITSSAALIALAGILITVIKFSIGTIPEYKNRRLVGIILSTSLVCGILTIIFSIIWLDDPHDILVILGSVTLGIQIAGTITPLIFSRLFFKF